LQETKTPYPLALGIAWHAGAEILLRGGTGEEAAEVGVSSAKSYGLGEVEQNWLLAAYLAWERAVAPEFFESWEVVCIEKEVEVPISPNVILQARADAVLRSRGDGSLWVLNWKTASDVKDWNRKWFFDVQAWTESLAMESFLGEPVAGCIFYGVWKGPVWNGQISSRLIHGYVHTSKTGSVTYGTENSGGGQRFKAWEMEFPFGEGVASWVNWLPKEFLKKHFVESAPQMRNDTLVEKWLRQLVRLEADVDHLLESGDEEDLEDYFFQNFSDINCARCPFLDLCMLRSTPEEKIKEGTLVPRIDHHEVVVESGD
jgi:hypothetical protein